MRLFIGTSLDKEHVEKIPFDNIQEIFEEDLKSIKKENVHMTWVFLGNVEATHAAFGEPRLRRELPLQEIIDRHINIFKGLIFTSKGLELWPPKRSPRLIVIKGNLNRDIQIGPLINDLKTISSPDIKEDFIPHITVCRFKKDKTVRAGFKPTLPKLENFIWNIKEVSLVQSILSNEGPSYEKVRSWSMS